MLSATQPLNKKLPAHDCRHVTIIMDGNGRRAKRQGKIHAFGHKAGAESVHQAVSFVANDGIETLTLHAFDSEGWNRPAQEVSVLMELFVWAFDNEVKNLHRRSVRLCTIGDTSRFNSRLQERTRKSEALTAGSTGPTLNTAASYSGRWDIIQEVRQLVEEVQQENSQPDQIDGEMLNQYACMHELVPVDSIVRTEGEHCISNFPLWQIAYAELYLTSVLRPDLDEQDLEGALNAFANRERRSGDTEPSNETT